MKVPIVMSMFLVIAAIILACSIAIKYEHFTSDQVSKDFSDVTGREPRGDELQLYKDVAATVDSEKLKDMIKRNETTDSVEDRMKAASSAFDSAIRDAAKDPSPALKKALSQSYNDLLCIAAEFDSLKQFYAFLQGTYKELLPSLYDALSEFPSAKSSCTKFHPENTALEELAKGNYSNSSLMCSFLSAQQCNDDAAVAGSTILGADKYRKAITWAKSNCGDTFGKCPMKFEGMQDAPDKGAKSDVQYVLNQPHIVYNIYGQDAKQVSTNNLVTPKELEDKVYKQCKLDAASKLPNINDVRRQREVDDLKDRCELSSKYTNADDYGKLFPEYAWSVPQPRAPVCVASAPCQVNAMNEQTALIGTLLEDANNTEVGSIMPRFCFKDNTQPAATKPGTSDVKKEEKTAPKPEKATM